MSSFNDNGDNLARALAGLTAAISEVRNPTEFTCESVSTSQAALQKLVSDTWGGGGGGGGGGEAAVAEASPVEKVLGEQDRAMLKGLFAQFDVDGNGTIDQGELQQLLHQNGVDLDYDKVGHIMDEVDGDGNREIDFDEFVRMIGPMLMKPVSSKQHVRGRRQSITLDGGIVVETAAYDPDKQPEPEVSVAETEEQRKQSQDSERKSAREKKMAKTSYGRCWRKVVAGYRDSSVYISPGSKERILWDMLMMVLIMYYAVATPMRIGFDIEPNEVMENVLTVLFFLDIVLNFFTGFYDKGLEVKNKSLIAKDYIKFWFWIDLMASFPFDVITTGGTKGAGGAVKVTKLFKIMRILKLLRLLKLGPILKRVKETLFGSSPNVLLLLKTMAALFFTWHWAACCYWFIASWEWETEFFDRAEGEPGHNDWLPQPWLINGDLGQSTLEDKYMHAFFWGVCVTTGIGWDVEPFTTAEVIYTTIMIIVGMLMYVTIIGGVTSIVSNMNSLSHERNKQMSKFEVYFRARMVPRVTQKKIKSYLEFLWSGDVSEAEDRKILHELPKELQMEVMLEVNAALVQQVHSRHQRQRQRQRQRCSAPTPHPRQTCP